MKFLTLKLLVEKSTFSLSYLWENFEKYFPKIGEKLHTKHHQIDQKVQKSFIFCTVKKNDKTLKTLYNTKGGRKGKFWVRFDSQVEISRIVERKVIRL